MRTPVNTGKEKGRGIVARALLLRANYFASSYEATRLVIASTYNVFVWATVGRAALPGHRKETPERCKQRPLERYLSLLQAPSPRMGGADFPTRLRKDAPPAFGELLDPGCLLLALERTLA